MIPLRRVLPSLLVLLAACAAERPPALPPSAGAFSMRDVAFPLRDLRFPSGLRVVVEEDHRAPLVAVIALVGAGSTSDPPGKEGLAHYVEHLTFRTRPDGAHSIAHLVERAGAGTHNAMTGLDSTRYYEMGPKEALPAFLALEGVRLATPIAQIQPEIAAVEREVVRNELRQRYESSYGGAIMGFLREQLYPKDHPYARPGIGTHESLSTLTLEDAQRFTAAHYRPDNVTLVVVGDIDLASVARVVEESLPRELLLARQGPPPAPRLDPTPPAVPSLGPDELVQRTAAVITPELWIGWSLPRGFDQDAWLEAFAADAVESRVHGRRYGDPDILGASVVLNTGKLASTLAIQVRLREGAHPSISAEQVLNEVENLWKHEALTERRKAAQELFFLDHQRYALTGTLLGAESIVRRGLARADFTHFAGDATAYSRQFHAMRAATPAGVEAFGARWLRPERARKVMVTPIEGSASPDPQHAADEDVLADLELPPAGDAETIRRFVRPPGVGAYQRVELENGLVVIAGRRAGLPLVSAKLSFHAAGLAPKPGVETVAPVAAIQDPEHHGYRPGIGVHRSSHFAADTIDFTMQGPAGNVAAILEQLSRQRLRRTGAPVVGTLLHDLVPAMKRLEALPELRADRAFTEALFGSSAVWRGPTAAEVDRVDAGDVNNWLERMFAPRNAVLAVVGEIDPAEVVTLAREWLGRWPDAGAPPPVAPEKPAGKPGVAVFHRPGATQGALRLGCLLRAGEPRARYDLIAALLDERLGSALRVGLGATYGVGARVRLRRGVPVLELTSNIDNAHLAQALAVVRSTLAALAEGRFEAGEIDATRYRLARAYAVRYGTNASIADAVAGARDRGRDLAAIDRYPEALLAVDGPAVAGDFARCKAAPVLTIVGDEPTAQAAIAASWP